MEIGQLLVGLEHFFFFHILGIIIPTDYYFSEELKPPTRLPFQMMQINHRTKSAMAGRRMARVMKGDVTWGPSIDGRHLQQTLQWKIQSSYLFIRN
jgi:hypothetical protein